MTSLRSEAGFALCEPEPHKVGPKPHMETRVHPGTDGDTWCGRPQGVAVSCHGHIAVELCSRSRAHQH